MTVTMSIIAQSRKKFFQFSGKASIAFMDRSTPTKSHELGPLVLCLWLGWHWIQWVVSIIFPISSESGESSFLSTRLNSWKVDGRLRYSNRFLNEASFGVIQQSHFCANDDMRWLKTTWYYRIPRQKIWSVWRMCWDAPPLEATSPLQNGDDRYERKPLRNNDGIDEWL